MQYHRPLERLLEPFFKNGLMMDGLKEKTFTDGPDEDQLQSYHNFPQIPMLIAIRFRRAAVLPSPPPASK
jgi:hypothetical protein